MVWRVVYMADSDVATLHAAEDYFLNRVGEDRKPHLLLTHLRKPGVSIAFNQSLRKDVNTTIAEERGVDIVRRGTGGGSVYLDSRHQIVSFIQAEGEEGDAKRNYEEPLDHIVQALGEVTSLDVSIANVNDLVVGGERKIGGAAQQRRPGVASLVHCYVRFSRDIESMVDLLQMNGVDLMTHRGEVEKLVSAIDIETPKIDYPEFCPAFREALVSRLGNESPRIEVPTAKEIAEIEKRSRKYKDGAHTKGRDCDISKGVCDLVEEETVKIKGLQGKSSLTADQVKTHTE